MDVTGRLVRFAVERPHPFLVAAPGGTAARLRVERECRQRGWSMALSPAEADLLVVCGSPGSSLTDALERVWEQIPAPRARVVAEGADDVGAALHEGRAALTDVAGQRAAAQTRAMSMPGGVDMAGRDGDRDGLMLDVLHVPLGPVLPDWPAGLVVHTTLQGDVVQRAEVETVDPGPVELPTAFWDEPWLRALAGERFPRGAAARRRAAAHLDSLGRLLALAGWPDAARAARRLRDGALEGLEGRFLAAEFDRFARRVRRSRLLRWMTRGFGELDAQTAARRGAGGPALRAGGDVASRWMRWLDECAGALASADDGRPLGRGDLEGPRGWLGGGVWPSRGLADVLPSLLEGAELARARLVVASLDPDPDELVGERAAAEVGR